MASFFTPASQKHPDQLTWRIVNSSLLVGRYSPHATRQASDALGKRRKIAAFDLVCSPDWRAEVFIHEKGFNAGDCIGFNAHRNNLGRHFRQRFVRLAMVAHLCPQRSETAICGRVGGILIHLHHFGVLLPCPWYLADESRCTATSLSFSPTKAASVLRMTRKQSKVIRKD